MSPDPRPPHFSAAGFRRGFLQSLPLLLSSLVSGIVMGIAYRGAGFALLPAVLFSVAVYSGTAQAVILGIWTTGPIALGHTALGAMAVACVATNARYLVMGAHLHRLFGGLRKRLMLPVLFIFADASWLMSVADADREAAQGRGPDAGHLLGASTPMAIGWISGTALGHSLPLTPTGPIAAAAALLPAAFIVALLPTQWRGRRSILPWTTAAIVALLVAHFVATSWAMVAGGAAGTALAMLGDDDA